MVPLWVGPEGVAILDSWKHLDESQKSDPTYVWNAFKANFESKTNFQLSCFQLRDLKQQPKETADAFVTHTKTVTSKCNFADIQDHLIEKFIIRVAHEVVQKKILDQDPESLTLDGCLPYANTHESTLYHLQQLHPQQSVAVIGNTSNFQKFMKNHQKTHQRHQHKTPAKWCKFEHVCTCLEHLVLHTHVLDEASIDQLIIVIKCVSKRAK